MIIVFSTGQEPNVSGSASPEELRDLQIQMLNLVAGFTQAIIEAKDKQLHERSVPATGDTDRLDSTG